jgi:hypothetical protein
MPNYQESKIYRIVSPSRPDLLPYYGATTVALCKRMVGHRCLKHACKSKELIECKDAIILLEENYPCNSKEELSKKEAEYILNNPCCNKMVPLRTRKEYYEENNEKIKEYNKEYNKKNNEKIKEYRDEYNEKNKTKIREREKEYREQNKEYRKQKVLCECGCEVSKINLSKHQKSKKHQKLLNQKLN